MRNKDISVYCLKYAESVIPESMVFLSGSKEKVIPISFAIYLIETQDKKILVDTGSNTMPGFVMKRFYSPVFVLRQIGFSADEITDVIITHAHHDHIEAVNYFKNAVIHINNQEYLMGKNYIPKENSIDTFEKECNIADNIKIVTIGGHSKGSSIVEINCNDYIITLCGDECYTDKCIEEKIPTGSYFDLDKSREFIEKYSNKKYRVHTCHDISLKTERII